MFTSWSSYQGSCRDDDSVSSLQAGVRAHCTVCGGMLTHTDICCWSAHFRGCCCHSIDNRWQYLPSNSECHVCGPGHWCAATAWPGCLRCSPRPPALATRPACTSTSLAAPAQFLQIFIQSCVCMFTHRQYTALPCVWRLWSVWCLYGELPLPPSWHCLLSLSISRWTVWAGQQHTGN